MLHVGPFRNRGIPPPVHMFLILGDLPTFFYDGLIFLFGDMVH